MRIALLGLAVLIGTFVAYAPTISGQESFFNDRYCAIGGGGRGSGISDCAYRTWEQCLATASGLGKYCSENPFWQPRTTGERIHRRESVRR
jgi:Protein of unknown function (DUF3551)